MTVLTACIEASTELSQTEPSSIFSTTDQFAKELRLQANRSAVAIAKAYDWQALTALKTMTGDGTTTSFPLPADYDRMPLKANVLTSQYIAGLRKVQDLDEWLNLQLRPVVALPGSWIILNGAMQILPAVATGVTANFYYIKNTIVTGAASAAQTAFLADADTFNLSERLLTLGIVWRWRASKKLEYAEDMANFETALAEEITRDKGSRVLTVGRQRISVGAEIAHPAISG